MLYGTAARFSCDPPSHPWGFTQAEIDAQLQEIDEKWGEGALIELFVGSIAEVDGVREWCGTDAAHRGAARRWRSSSGRRSWRSMFATCCRSVETPTLVLHRRGDRVVPYEAAAAMAAALPNAVLRELSPGDHVGFDIGDSFVSEILGFVVGEQRVAPATERVLATVLFTDIVGSTETVSAQGDERWRQRLDAHDEIVERHLAEFGGRKVKHTGDGVFAVFDGPTKAARCALDLVPALGDPRYPHPGRRPHRRVRAPR